MSIIHVPAIHTLQQMCQVGLEGPHLYVPRLFSTFCVSVFSNLHNFTTTTPSCSGGSASVGPLPTNFLSICVCTLTRMNHCICSSRSGVQHLCVPFCPAPFLPLDTLQLCTHAHHACISFRSVKICAHALVCMSARLHPFSLDQQKHTFARAFFLIPMGTHACKRRAHLRTCNSTVTHCTLILPRALAHKYTHTGTDSVLCLSVLQWKEQHTTSVCHGPTVYRYECADSVYMQLHWAVPHRSSYSGLHLGNVSRIAQSHVKKHFRESLHQKYTLHIHVLKVRFHRTGFFFVTQKMCICFTEGVYGSHRRCVFLTPKVRFRLTEDISSSY